MSLWSQNTGRWLITMTAASLLAISSGASAQEKLDASGFSAAAGVRIIYFSEEHLLFTLHALRDSATGTKPKIDMQKYVPIARKQIQ